MREVHEPKEFLPDWGPYSKKYMGVSRVGFDAEVDGARFDLVVHPAEANMNQPVPNVTYPSSWHMWEAAPDLSYYAYRVELEWKDVLYADVSFSALDGHTRLVRTEFVNDSDLDRVCVLNYFLALEYPRKKIAEIVADGSFSYKKFTKYDRMAFHTPRPWDHLTPDGNRRGEFFDASFVDGRGFGERAAEPEYVKRTLFGEEAGDTVTLTVDAGRETFDLLTIRYRTTGEEAGRFALTVSDGSKRGSFNAEITLPASSELTTAAVALGGKFTGRTEITLTSLGGGGVELDFAALSHKDTAVSVATRVPDFEPETAKAEFGDVLSYKGTKAAFGFCPLSDSVRERRVLSGALEDALPSRLSQADPTFDRVLRSFTRSFTDKRSDEGFYKNYIVHSIFIPAGERRVEYALVGDGSVPSLPREAAEAAYVRARGALRDGGLNPDGAKYEQGRRMLEAALLTNVVYPISRHGEWIKHHTPGKRWDCLYTWDSGFIGLGLLEVSPVLAKYVLDLYLSDEKNEDFAFLHHGSPVPVQAYLFLELLQRANDKTELYERYPRMRRYYRYLAGKAEGSVTDPFKSRMTTTFSYFYSCSGMDDLPPQAAMHARGMQFDCAPALTTSQLIRVAKILRMTASEAGYEDDVREYDADIKLRSEALLKYAWDEESGYFGYVVHDKDKNPIGIFRDEGGVNLSCGMDGVYPLVAGICDEEREARLIGHIFSESEMFSPVGISAVDMTAPYYRDNGYWNGNVWFSHQWFLWKTMLDLGYGDGAQRIAICALEAWAREVGHSYFTFEMLNIKTGRGGWFHHFGGLSAPIDVWADAYFRPGTVTVGFDMWIKKQSYDAEADALTVTVKNHGSRPGLLLAVLKDADGVTAALNGVPTEAHRRTSGAVEVKIPEGDSDMAVTIRRGGAL